MAYFFNNSPYMQLSGAGLAAPTEFTISAWHYPWDTSTTRNLICHSNGSPSAAHTHQIVQIGSNWAGYVYDGNAYTFAAPGAVVQYAWQHVAVTAKNGGTAYLYINGLQANQQTGIATLWAGGNDWWVGVPTAGGAWQCVYGHLAEVCCWHKQLTAAQIRQLACKVRRVPLQIERESLKFYFPMPPTATDQTVTSWADESGVGLTQTLTGNPIATTDPFMYP